jgi:hypothetical protein
MARSKKKKAPREPRNMVVLGMILHRHAKRWDARQRRAKDARAKREAFE